MQAESKFVVQAELGLHARPAGRFVILAGRFESEISVAREDDDESLGQRMRKERYRRIRRPVPETPRCLARIVLFGLRGRVRRRGVDEPLGEVRHLAHRHAELGIEIGVLPAEPRDLALPLGPKTS